MLLHTGEQKKVSHDLNHPYHPGFKSCTSFFFLGDTYVFLFRTKMHIAARKGIAERAETNIQKGLSL